MATTDTTYSNPAAPRRAARAANAVRQLETDRLIGIVGALTVVVATGLAWYSERVSIVTRGVVDYSSTGVSLWHVRNLAAWLLVAGAAIGIVGLLLPAVRQRRGAMVAAVAGFGIALYSVVAMFAVPDLGSATLAWGFATVADSTSLDVGPFVALLGGLMLLAGGATAASDS